MIHMEATNPLIRLPAGQELKLSNSEHQLYVGRILKTVVVQPLEQNQVLININGNNINAKSSHQLNPGDLLDVKVIRMTQDEILLQIINKPEQNSIVQQMLARYLPYQQDAAQLLNVLALLQQKHILPSELLALSQQLLRTLPDLSAISQQLAQIITNSGIFLESRLLHRDKTLRDNKDFKALLLKMLNKLPQHSFASTSRALKFQPTEIPMPGILSVPPRMSFSSEWFDLLNDEEALGFLRQQVKGALARLISYQLQHIPSVHDNTSQLLMLDIPLKVGDNIYIIPLHIQKAPPKKPGDAHGWQVEFTTELPQAGCIQACLKLCGQKLDVYLNTQNLDTKELLNTHQQSWHKLVTNMGLEAGNWQIVVGLKQPPAERKNFHMVDIYS